jgi:hypothetical protein
MWEGGEGCGDCEGDCEVDCEGDREVDCDAIAQAERSASPRDNGSGRGRGTGRRGAEDISFALHRLAIAFKADGAWPIGRGRGGCRGGRSARRSEPAADGQLQTETTDPMAEDHPG